MFARLGLWSVVSELLAMQMPEQRGGPERFGSPYELERISLPACSFRMGRIFSTNLISGTFFQLPGSKTRHDSHQEDCQ